RHSYPTNHTAVSHLSPTVPPPPTSPLFPYTTLFRSRVRHRPPTLGTGDSGATGAWVDTFLTSSRETGCAGACTPSPRYLAGAARDRKSTRLNSSHRTISYAVFCLKKKNKTAATLEKP